MDLSNFMNPLGTGLLILCAALGPRVVVGVFAVSVIGWLFR